ncbi:MAG: chorismate synthase [Taibaiella sp.]|nr:chorismate synthase [Taibaiella sp.]
MNTYGRTFRVHIFGESHGPMVGVTIDGCPAGISMKHADLLPDLERRKAGATGTTQRKETDEPEIVSGIFNEVTTGAPITILFRNADTRSADYESIRNTPRPGHADFVLHKKYDGYNDYRGGGYSSGRLTVALVAAGVIAKKVLNEITIQATLTEAGGNTNIDAAIEAAVTDQDSIGGIVSCVVRNIPVGWGEPFFDSAESVISHAVFAVPAIKGIEFGSGFGAAKMKGSVHNDAIMNESGTTQTNNAGGINGGITNGNELYFRVAVKPTSSTPRQQQTWNNVTASVEAFAIMGRHDLCIALRVPVVIEAATAIALADLKLMAGK